MKLHWITSLFPLSGFCCCLFTLLDSRLSELSWPLLSISTLSLQQGHLALNLPSAKYYYINKQLAFRKWKDSRFLQSWDLGWVLCNQLSGQILAVFFFSQSIKIQSWTETWLAIHIKYIMKSMRAFVFGCRRQETNLWRMTYLKIVNSLWSFGDI